MRVAYEADGWGEGELWFAGSVLVWHELPRPRPADTGSVQPGRTRTRRHRTGPLPPNPHPGGANSRHPLRSTIPAKRMGVGDEIGPEARQLAHRLQTYFGGERVDFDDVVVDLDGYTPFQLDVVRALREVPYGEVVTYGELAHKAGHVNAQRAAGTFCAQNRFPLVLPCHRVVAAGGIGSYGSLGIEYKRRLLELEGCSSAL